MIVTLTPNPSVDRTLEVSNLRFGEINRAGHVTIDAGGKGINIARALAASNLPTRAVLPVGGVEGGEIARLLATDGVETVLVPIAESIRMNISIVEPGGIVTKVNEPGPYLLPEEEKSLLQATVDAAIGSSWLVLSGTLPRGVGADFYSRIIGRVRDTGVKIAVDTSGEALDKALIAQPDLVKPNLAEMEELLGGRILTLKDVVNGGQLIMEKGARAVLITLGSDGAVFMNQSTILYGEVRPSRVESAVGAGDALLAGFLSTEANERAKFKEGLAWAAAAIALPGTKLPKANQISRSAVYIHDRIDLAKQMTKKSRR
ncbi:MAG: 1-phosphofructokinase family hexose kinase [Actinomycetota bacterium]|nr:1-phosphofructokinase family hexose kinase [Actinomycetota bacterium]